jgi:hypothetical protein
MQIEFKHDDLFQEVEDRTIYQADSINTEGGDTLTERLAATTTDHILLATFLKDAADEVYMQLQTITFSNYPYVYAQGKRLLYNIVNTYPSAKVTVLFSTIKSYLVEKMLSGWWRHKGQKELWLHAEEESKRIMSNLNSLRFIGKPKLIYRPL